MILYFDSYITDIPLHKFFVDANEKLRLSTKNYAMPRKVDIAKYTLSSYVKYPWSHVLIRYELDDKNQYLEFDTFIKKLFPNAIILHERSDSQKDFKESLKIIKEFNDNWIFYSGNNDHPLIAPDILHIDLLLKIANSYINKYPFISLPYSHFSEYINLPRKGNPSHSVIGLDSEIITEDDLAITVLKKEGEYSSVQIVNKNLLIHWFESKDLDNNRIIRTEDVRKYVTTPNQLMIIPKKEICAHFDGYSHTIRGINEILPNQVPPLFIPIGFFENNIKIAYGYNSYREGWTNINPLAEKYSFEDNKYGTDLKIKLEDIPLFWKEKIKEIDINEEINMSNLILAANKNYSIIRNPWKFGNKKINLNYILFILRNLRFKLKRLI